MFYKGESFFYFSSESDGGSSSDFYNLGNYGQSSKGTSVSNDEVLAEKCDRLVFIWWATCWVKVYENIMSMLDSCQLGSA